MQTPGFLWYSLVSVGISEDKETNSNNIDSLGGALIARILDCQDLGLGSVLPLRKRERNGKSGGKFSPRRFETDSILWWFCLDPGSLLFLNLLD